MNISTISNPLCVKAPLNVFVRDYPFLQDCNPESLDTSLNIMTLILKVSIPVLISRLKS